MKNMQKYEQLAITELDAYLFGQGTHYEIYNKMGAHVAVKDGKEGVYFAVWAPAAREVYVIGEFNNWNAYGYDMKKIRQDNDAVQIIFITGYSDYIAEGYEVNALHYLMKPVKEEKLFSVLERAIEKISKNDVVLNMDSANGMVRVPIYQIRFAEVFGNYVTIHANDEVIVKMTLNEIEKLLDERFYRVGRSVIVNLNEVSRVTKTEIKLLDGTSIHLPRGAYDGVNRAIINMR